MNQQYRNASYLNQAAGMTPASSAIRVWAPRFRTGGRPVFRNYTGKDQFDERQAIQPVEKRVYFPPEGSNPR